MNQITRLAIVSGYVITSFYLMSCQTGSATEEVTSEPEQKIKTYVGAKLVQIDSIMLDVIGSFKIYDYQPESGLFLGGDVQFFITFPGRGAPKSNELGLIIFDRKGKVVHQFNNTNGGPNGHGSAMQSAFFMGPDAIGVLGLLGLYKYSLGGKLIKKYKDINYQGVMIINQAKSGFSSDGNMLALRMSKSLSNAKAAYSDSLFTLVKPVKVYDLDRYDNSKLPIHEYSYPDDPSRDLKLGASTIPLMALNPFDSLLYTVYQDIPEVTTYDLRSDQVKGTIPLNPDKFEDDVALAELAGRRNKKDWLNDGGRVAKSKYHEMVQLGEYTLLRYSSAVPINAVRLLTTTPGLREDPNWPEIRRRHYKFYYQLIKDGKKVLPDFELSSLRPEKQHLEFLTTTLTRGQVIGGNGLHEIFVFIPNDGEEERDYELIRVYKLELQEE